MPKSSTLLTESICNKASASLKEMGSSGIVAVKLKAIISAKEHGIKKVADILKISKTSLTFWIKRFNQDAAAGLLAKPKKPRSSILDKKQKLLISKWISDDPNLTINKIRLKIIKEMGVEISKTTVHRIIQKTGFSHITARSVHYKQDKEKLEEFKKNSNRNKRKKSK
jgi:transposase